MSASKFDLAAENEKARLADDRLADLFVKAMAAVGRRTVTALIERDTAGLQAAKAAEADLFAEVKTRGGVVPANHWHERWQFEQRLRALRAMLEILEELS